MNQRALLLVVFCLSVPSVTAAQTDSRPAPDTKLSPSRPGPLLPLYVGFATAQALDLHSTYVAIQRGGREGNPLVSLVSKRPVAAVAIKAGLTGGTIWAAERMWKRQRRTGAVVLLAAVTALQAAVDAHNYRVAARLR